jgi:hypothetical protein
MAVPCASRIPGDLPGNAPPARGEVRGCVGRMRLADTSSGTQTPTATPRGGRLHSSLCFWSRPQWGLHHTGSLEATSAPPHHRASREEEERYSGYFSCFVIRTIMLCLPARSPLPGSTGPQKSMPRIALRRETRQAARFLPAQGSDERKQTRGNLRSLLMTFTIVLTFLTREPARNGRSSPLLEPRSCAC